MRKHSKILAFILGISITASLLAGCSANGLAIYNGFKKSTTINSAEVQTDVSLKFSGENMSQQEKEAMKDTINMLNGSEVHILSKYNQNTDKTNFKSQLDISGKFASKEFATSIWTKADSSTSSQSATEIVKLPSNITDKILELKGKDYIVATSDDAAQPNTIDYNKLAQLQPKLSALVDTYLKNYNPLNDPIKNLGKQTITQSGKKVDVTLYKLTLTDSSLKNLLHYTVNNLSDNKQAIDQLKDYLLSVVSVLAPTKDDADTAAREIENSFTEFNKNLPDIIKELDSQLSVFDNIKILGDKGIVVQFAIDEDGYIVNEQGDIQIVINSADLSKLSGDTSNSSTAIYTEEIHFNTDIRNINKNVEVVFPKTTKENSVTMKLTDAMGLVSIYNAHDFVDQAVASNNEEMLTSAKNLVMTLPEGKDKTSMLKQVNTPLNKILTAKSKDFIKKAKASLLISDYETAVSVINELPSTTSKPLLADLNTVYNKVYTSEVKTALSTVKTFTNDKNKDLKKYDTAKIAITKGVKSEKNRQYILDKLSIVADKDVFTPEVNSALNAIDAAKKNPTAANIKTAKTAISKVKNKESAKYLQAKLDKIKVK